MKILFVVTDDTKKKQKETMDMLSNLLPDIKKTGDKITHLNVENDLYYTSIPKVQGTFDYVMLLKGTVKLANNFRTIIEEHMIAPRTLEDGKVEKQIYLPLVVLTNEKMRGVLNSTLWNSNLAPEVGILEHDLAIKQLDTTLYGALVPYDVIFNESYYKPELKYYQHFHILNKFTKDEKNVVFGIPKTLLFTDVDLSFSTASNDEKIAQFKLAKEI